MTAQRLGLSIVALCLAAAGIAIGIWFSVARDNAAHPAESKSVQLVLSNPQALYGKRITVRGSISGSFTPHSFTLGASNPGPNDLLVVRYGKAVHVQQNQVVDVVGVVQRFSLADYDKKEDVNEVNAGLLQAFAGKPVLVADEVTTIR